MARARIHGNLAGLVDSDSEDDLGGVRAARATAAKQAKSTSTTTTTVKEKMPPAKKTRGRPAAANKVTKPTQQRSNRRASDRVAAAVERAAEEEEEEQREVLAEKTNVQPKAAPRAGRKATAASLASPPQSDDTKPAPRARGRPKRAAPPAAGVAPARRGRKPAAPAPPLEQEEPEAADETEIPETQQPADAMDVDQEEETTQMEALPAEEDPEPEPVQRKQPAARRRSGVVDSEGSDAAVRRRLGDLTRKYDALEAKYRDLRDIGVKEAERNFDRLKKQGDDKTKGKLESHPDPTKNPILLTRETAYNDLIASLKSELATQRDLAREGERFKKQLEASEAKVDSLQANITSLTSSLSDAKTEIKSLSTKLAAARSSEMKVPGSALKAGAAASREALQANSQAAQMKEILYGDLTGLIVRGVKRESEQDVYDCIQTGRNGTLHFKLTIGNDSAKEDYDEAQFMYKPQLDANRDRALIEVLPDYLVEEITFPRPHAAKFYARVMKSLTERLE
ncbi:uncharacterized protein E0L32_010077 [Thyridium curvatum]|uniref:Monopolin complex subunit Csm1/Pcs1 C-terminal domain-containing protein n=1 Tax=Thyridium curvatum TaxID=1093900 RepID=A0A507AW18_9PEZI|nr:uncharacterized protein E0L32_010077 [Thyridium curvatum]TPX08460.1 hypothetical protein E0L32_010077 [Thyridium curvatum]